MSFIMDKQDLINNITNAFSGVELGDGVGLLQAQAMDDWEPEDVQEKSRQNDEKKDWQSIKYEALDECRSSLSFFDEDGMRFHIPAYIIGSILDEVDDPIFHLTQLDDFGASRFSSLNQKQKESIIMYLHWCIAQEEYSFDIPSIKRALNEFWEK